jgi:hypothetical protein
MMGEGIGSRISQVEDARLAHRVCTNEVGHSRRALPAGSARTSSVIRSEDATGPESDSCLLRRVHVHAQGDRALLTSGDWQFVQDDDGRWRWIYAEQARAASRSADTFETYIECALDAVRHAVDARRE